MPVVDLKNISLCLGGKEIFDNFSMSIDHGEKILLQGDSGSGKSTLMNIIMGFIAPQDGSVSVFGLEFLVNNLKEIRSRMTWMPQNQYLTSDKPVVDFIMHPFDFAINKAIKPRRNDIINLLERFGMNEKYLSEVFSGLSGGEKQRIALIICCLLKRELIMLDEPVSALDDKCADSVIDLFLTESKATVISSSHNPLWVSKCSRMVVIGEYYG